MDQGSYYQNKYGQQQQTQSPEDLQSQHNYYEYSHQSPLIAPPHPSSSSSAAPELPPKVRITENDVDNGYDPFSIEHRFGTSTTRFNSQQQQRPPPLPSKIPSHNSLPVPPPSNDINNNYYYYSSSRPNSSSYHSFNTSNPSISSDSSQRLPQNDNYSTTSFVAPYPTDTSFIPEHYESHPYGRSLPQLPDDLEPYHDLRSQVSQLKLDTPVSLPYPVDYDQSNTMYIHDDSELTDNSFDHRSISLNDDAHQTIADDDYYYYTNDESESLHSPISRSPLKGVPELTIPNPFADENSVDYLYYSSSPETMKGSIYPPPMRLSPQSSPPSSSKVPKSPLHPRRKPLPCTPWENQHLSPRQNDDNHEGYTDETIIPPSSPSPLHSSSPISRDDDDDGAFLKPSQSLMFDKMEPTAADYPLMVKLNLPILPRSKSMFLASSIDNSIFTQCSEPWALSCVFEWLKKVIPLSTRSSRTEIELLLSRLFEFVIPSMNWVYSGVYANLVIEELIKANALIILQDQKQQHYQLDFSNDIKVSGVLPIFTGQGCYSSQCCSYDLPCYKCYSYKCCTSLHSVSPLEIKDSNIDSDWAKHWGLNEEDLKILNPKDIKRQYAIHEIISGEENFLKDLEIWILVFRDGLINSKIEILKNQKNFIDLCFNHVPKIISINRKYLLIPLKERQRNQGHFIRNIADIFLDWAKHSEKVLVSYATKHVYANRQMRMEREDNPLFKEWLETTSKNPALDGRPYAFFFSRIIPRVVRYTLLLKAVLNRMRPCDEEYPLLERAISACDIISHKVDAAVGEAEKQTELLDLATNVEWKYPEYQTDFKMNDPKRKIIQKGKVVRRGDHRFDWVESELILLDNYLIITKSKTGSSKYYITKPPIPLALLILESVDDPPVVKSSSTARLGVGTMTSAIDVKNNQSPKSSHSKLMNESGGDNNNNTTPISTIIDSDKDIMYPIRVRHAGRFGRSYALYTSSEMARNKWKDAILIAKKHHYSLIQSSRKEPFTIKILSDYDFRYSNSTAPHSLPIPEISSTMDRAIKHRPFQNNTLPTFQTRVYAACRFSTSTDKEILALGCEDGIYIPSGTSWTRCISTPNVTSIKTLNGFDCLLVLSDKNLLSYSLDAFSVMISRNRALPHGDNSGQEQSQHHHHHRYSGTSKSRGDNIDVTLTATRISGGRDVGFFVTGNLMGRSLIVYKRRENLSSMLKFMEPITEQNLSRRRTQLVGGGGVNSPTTTTPTKGKTTNNSGMLLPVEYFRQFDQLEYSGDCTNATLFNTSIGIISKGIDITTLDCKTFRTIPEQSSINNNEIKKRLDGCKPIGIFRISEFNYLICYDSIAIYINNHGEIINSSTKSSSRYLNFIGKIQNIIYQHPYLICIDSNLIEIHNVENLNICQLLIGTNFKILNSTESQIIISCVHPYYSSRQVIFELVRNEWE